MGLSIKNIKKWWRMIRGKSLLHVEQGKGKIYSFSSVQGYYNDLTNKVLLDEEIYNSTEIVKYNKKGNYFPISVFQYGLGCYDLYLQDKDKNLMKSKFLKYLDWTFTHQQDDGSWLNFIDDYPDHPYSSMAQGEGASLLIRGFVLTGQIKYLEAAKKALIFMLKPLSEGGTCAEDNENLILYEFTFLPYVYNGWIFSIFGLMDYCIQTNDMFFQEKLNKTILTLSQVVGGMDNGYWSMYRNDKTIASPFYHHLHIAQLQVLYEYTKIDIFKETADKFLNYENSKKNRKKAFQKKALQKIFSR